MFSDVFQNQSSYYRFEKGISNEEADTLRMILDTKELQDAQVFGDGAGELDKTKRRSKVFWLPKTDEFIDLYKQFHRLVRDCNSEFYQFKLTELAEPIQYTVYSSDDEGFYDWHIDMGSDKARRKLSLVCQLSDPSEYDGGELQFNIGKVIVAEKEKGAVILFPSYLLHRVTPVTRGVRRSLVLWVEGPAFI